MEYVTEENVYTATNVKPATRMFFGFTDAGEFKLVKASGEGAQSMVPVGGSPRNVSDTETGGGDGGVSLSDVPGEGELKFMYNETVVESVLIRKGFPKTYAFSNVSDVSRGPVVFEKRIHDEVRVTDDTVKYTYTDFIPDPSAEQVKELRVYYGNQTRYISAREAVNQSSGEETALTFTFNRTGVRVLEIDQWKNTKSKFIGVTDIEKRIYLRESE